MILRSVIMGLLFEKPQYGYELKQKIEDRQLAQYLSLNTSSGAIYYTLKQLTQEGLLSVEAPERRGRYPERSTYRLTPHGEKALHKNLLAIANDPMGRAHVDPLYVPLSFAQFLSPEELRSALEHQRKHAAGVVEWMTGMAERLQGTIPFVRMAILRHGLMSMQAEIAWLDETIRGLLAIEQEQGRT